MKYILASSGGMSRITGPLLVASLMVLSATVAFGSVAGTASGSPSTLVGASLSASTSAVSAPSGGAIPSTPATGGSGPSPSPNAPSYCSSLKSVYNDPQYAAFVEHVNSISRGEVAAGLPSADVNLPYAGPIADQTVNGVPMAGSQLSAECGLGQPITSQTVPTGVDYYGQTDLSSPRSLTLDSNSVAGILTVNSQPQDFYPGSATPTVWGAQENVVLPNVTLFGQECPTLPCSPSGNGNYAFWIQNVVSYDSFNDTIYFVDDTWNFTSYTSQMFDSSLVGWSPTGSNYTGVWVAYSQYFYVPPPFTVTTYVNTSVDSAGDQILWYNYSIQTPTHFVANGNYDYLIFNSQPTHGHLKKLLPPDFEASAVTYHVVPEDFEFDAFIGADDGSNNLMLAANATMKLQYCVQVPYCTSKHFAYANVPAAVNYGMETGEETIGIAVNYVGSIAYFSAGPVILHGLWNFTGQSGVHPGQTKVTNSITVAGDPEGPLSTQPYFFVFFESKAFGSQGFQWAPDVPAWFLMPGKYRYEIMLADYAEQTGTISVGSAPTTLKVTLQYAPWTGVYTPLWAFGNGQLAGISFSGAGTLSDQYLPFNNPTTGYYLGIPPQNLSSNFLSFDDYLYPSFPGVLFDGTSAYVDLNAPPTFCVTGYGLDFYLGIEFFETSHVTLAHDANTQGWPAWSEIDFYYSVPASQNAMPVADVFVWNSTDDLIMSNTLIATANLSFAVAPDGLVLYGGTNNVVWGNTFEDPPGTALNVTGPNAGIGLGESGDLIYNNNFSVDDPVVYLPYNWVNVADCLPQTLGPCASNGDQNPWYYNDAANVVGNTWNVPLQSAQNVVYTVNGFPLSGNVLGPSIGTQGGNYYWNYGTSPNNYTTSPYVSRFNASEWSEEFPLGCGTIQAPGAPCGTPPPVVAAYVDGITAGGDYAPYGPTVIFHETGLPTGAAWSVTIGGTKFTSTASSLVIAEPFGSYTYTVAATGQRAHPSSGTVFVSGAVSVDVHFTRHGTHLGPAVEPAPVDGAGWLAMRGN
jgi:Thermopsin